MARGGFEPSISSLKLFSNIWLRKPAPFLYSSNLSRIVIQAGLPGLYLGLYIVILNNN